jgi:hypothetical protein
MCLTNKLKYNNKLYGYLFQNIKFILIIHMSGSIPIRNKSGLTPWGYSQPIVYYHNIKATMSWNYVRYNYPNAWYIIDYFLILYKILNEAYTTIWDACHLDGFNV